MEYVYNATGEKQSVTFNVLMAGGNYTYCDNFIYYNGSLSQILVDGGYISFNGSTPTYYYYLKDHLGSNRVTVRTNGTVVNVSHYYPFGGLFGESTGVSDMAYKYNGKEFERLIGLDWYDYGARYMDCMRFTTMDPMAEKYYNISPYVYCANNPIYYIDPDGCDWVQRKHDGIKEFYYDRNIKSQKDIDRLYGANSGINYIPNKSSYELGGETYTFFNDVKKNKYGYVTKGTKKQDNTNILYGDNYTIFGSSDNSVDARTLHKNYFGTSYTGPNNPKDYSGNDSYQYIPRNKSEYGSYIHDLLYDKANAKGTDGALNNTTPEVIKADIFLTKYNIINMMNPQTPLLDRGRSALTASAFFFVVGYKTLLNTIKR